MTTELASNLPLEDTPNIPLKKKRGRKPKEVKVEVINKKVINIIDSLKLHSPNDIENDTNVSNNGNDNIQPIENAIDEQQTETPKKGKRGRKPKYVYASYNVANQDEQNNMSSISDDENVIVRLNINDIELCDDYMKNDEHPYAYNHDTYKLISNVADSIDDKETQQVSSTHDTPTNFTNNQGSKVVNILQDFEEKNKHNEWPLNTSISCYWCCHRFDNSPYGIPINYVNERFEVFGCFCSLECATAYNFHETTNVDEMWERYNLINLLSRRLQLGNLVKCAPPRLSLKIFGGHMDIGQFRSFTKKENHKFINVNFPPMTSITQQLEEINDFELNNDLKYIPIDNERINKYKEKIIFKRNKPLIDSTRSLETTMNLKYE
jgi:hypothetical protein